MEVALRRVLRKVWARAGRSSRKAEAWDTEVPTPDQVPVRGLQGTSLAHRVRLLAG